jgi:hypothetical protein
VKENEPENVAVQMTAELDGVDPVVKVILPSTLEPLIEIVGLVPAPVPEAIDGADELPVIEGIDSVELAALFI